MVTIVFTGDFSGPGTRLSGQSAFSAHILWPRSPDGSTGDEAVSCKEWRAVRAVADVRAQAGAAMLVSELGGGMAGPPAARLCQAAEWPQRSVLEREQAESRGKPSPTPRDGEP